MNRRRMIRRGATYGPALPDGAPDDGVDRGIAAFIIWIYVRYKRESRRRMNGTPAPVRRSKSRPEATPREERTGGTYDLLDRYRRNVEEAEAEYDRQHGITSTDPGVQAWQDYVQDLHRKDPPGKAPDES